MSNGSSPRSRGAADGEAPDEWLLDAARRAGHKLPQRERPAGTSAWRLLLSAGIAEAEVLALACAASGTEAADFAHLSPALGSLLPHGVALQHRVAPLGVHHGTLSVATSNPRSPALERELAFAAKQRVRLLGASPTDIIRAQGVVYGTMYGTRGDDSMVPPAPAVPSVSQPRPAAVGRLSQAIVIPPEAVSPAKPEPEPEAAPAQAPVRASAPVIVPDTIPAAAPAPTPLPTVPDLTERLLVAAITELAAEAVLEPTPDGGLLVRLRVDGRLNDRFRIADTNASRIVATLKARAALNADETRHPQQGRMVHEATGSLVVIRMATEPVGAEAERVVLSFYQARTLTGLGELGFSPAEHHHVMRLLASPAGLVVIAGPAGAGRTTTLYAAARDLRAQGRSVSTVETHLEYPLDRIAQVLVDEAPPATLASAVRGVLAAEGDVVVVGAPLDAATLAMRDGQAAGARLVIGTLDTPDMTATLTRLTELAPDRASLAASLQGVVVQRLVRRLCPTCALPQPVSELPELQQRLLYGLPTARVRRPVGCAACRTTGYLGRMVIAEVMPVTPPLRAAMARGVSSARLAEVAQESGMPSLWDSGMARVLEGTTSLAELLDTVPPPPEHGLAAPQDDIDALLAQLLGSPHMQPEAAAVATEAAAPRGVLRVLVVDDDAIARRALARELAGHGMEVLQAADGRTALAYARRLVPDLILTEVAIPGLDAIGLLAALAADATRPAVVVHTEQTDRALDAWLREAGARDVLPRDMPVPVLAARLHDLLRPVTPA